MEIINFTETIIKYLLITSVLLLVMGLLGFITIKFLKIRGRVKLWIFGLIFILPLAYPLKTMFPETIEVPVYLKSWQYDYFKQNHTVSENIALKGSSLYPDTPGVIDDGDVREIYTRDNASGYNVDDWSINPVKHWKLITVSVWVLVFSFFILRLITSGFKIKKFIKFAEPVTNPQIIRLMSQCASDTGLHHVPQLFVVERVSTPMVIGFFKPIVIIPNHLLRSEFREGLQFTLLHEFEHLRHHHNWWLLVESIICSAYFFHPVIYWAKNKIHEELELICDNHVINVTDKSVSYADFLLNEIWQQNLGTTPVSVLPFVSPVSKTSTRIHSILSNVRPSFFAHIRGQFAIFSFLLLFSSILVFSIVPLLHKPEMPFNNSNPLIRNSQNSTSHQAGAMKFAKEASLIEKPSIRTGKEQPFFVEKPVSEQKIEARAEDSEKTFRGEPISNSLSDIKNMYLTESAEIAEKNKKTLSLKPKSKYIESIVPLDESANKIKVEKSNQTKQDFPTIKITADNSREEETMAVKYLGSPVNALTIYRINDIRTLDEYTILFIMYGGKMYLTRLSNPCPALLYASDFNLVTNQDRFSKFDRIQTLAHGHITGTAGMLSSFYPFSYKGKKSEAIKLLKRSLLKKLVDEGAFKES